MESGLGSSPDKRIQLKVSNGLDMIVIPALEHPGDISWSLPPSKSHMIRWIALASQSEGVTEIQFSGKPGDDIHSMADCMEKMGVVIDRGENNWFVKGAIKEEVSKGQTLDCGNSATTARIVTSIAAGLGETLQIDGDKTLRSRDSSQINNALRGLGCEVSSDRMPFSISGPVVPGTVRIDESKTSQTLTGLLLASPGYPEGTRVHLEGERVSRGYRELTIEICKSCGWGGCLDSHYFDIGEWVVRAPEFVEIPEEISLLPLSLLFDRLHGTKSLKVEPVNSDPRIIAAVDATMSCNGGQVDLRDASDIISPAAAILALGGGGRIVGSSHSRGKESDRIGSTCRMLSSFGISSEERIGGLEIPGGQSPISPPKPVDSEGDHRLAMTSMVLATSVGAEIDGGRICSITHPDFIEMLVGDGENL